MDYFLMHNYIFLLIIKNKPKFIIELLKSININIKYYELFSLSEDINDILLFSDNLVINIELNKNTKSLVRNKVYLDTISKILTNYNLIQININLFNTTSKINKNNYNIYNYYKENEYLKFITCKNYLTFKTENKIINEVKNYISKIDIKNIENILIEQNNYKEYLDNLIKE